MADQSANIVCWLLVVTIIVVGGCEQEYKEEPVAYNPLADANLVAPDYASRAIEAVGGRQAWVKAEKLEFECVVTFYRPDDSFYLTEQRHEIHPSMNSIRISAEEPQGKFVCELSEGRFRVLEEAELLDALQPMAVNRCFAEAVLCIATAPVRFLDGPVEFIWSSELAKIEGRWYYSIERTSIDKRGIWPRAVFYQDRDSSLVDMIWFADVCEEKFLAVRGYDYTEVGKGGILVPTKIDMFSASASGALGRRLVEVHYYAIRAVD